VDLNVARVTFYIEKRWIFPAGETIYYFQTTATAEIDFDQKKPITATATFSNSVFKQAKAAGQSNTRYTMT